MNTSPPVTQAQFSEFVRASLARGEPVKGVLEAARGLTPALLADNSAGPAALAASAAPLSAPAGPPAPLRGGGLLQAPPAVAPSVPVDPLPDLLLTSPLPPNPATLPQCSVALQAPAGKSVALPTHGLTAQDIVDYLVQHPDTCPKSLAAHYKKSFRWLAAVISTDAFQATIGPVKHLIVDPFYSASMAERFQALTLQSLDVLSAQLEKPDVSEFTVTKAAEIGFKALGLGQSSAPAPTAPAVEVGPEAVADRILAAIASAKERTNKLTVVTDVTPKEA